MPQRTIELLALGEDLRTWAGEFTDDVNEAYFLVHEALTRAFRDDPDIQPGPTLYCVLRDEMRLIAADLGCAHRREVDAAYHCASAHEHVLMM